jgi:myo-inositol-1-phosphate synthase
VKIALDRRIVGPLFSVSAAAFKHPPKSMPMETAEKQFEEFVQGKRER